MKRASETSPPAKRAHQDVLGELKEQGYCIIRGVAKGEELTELQEQFSGDYLNFPLIKADKRQDFHDDPAFSSHGFVPWFMHSVHTFMVLALVAAYLSATMSHFVMITDRDCVNPKGVKKAKGKAHRDEPSKAFDYPILQGYMQVDGVSCLEMIPGTHRKQTSDKSGFRPLTKEDNKALDKKFVRVVVRPGDVLLFDPTIIHRAVGMTFETLTRRTHFAVGLGTEEKPAKLPPTYAECEREGIAPQLPSGQRPPVWEKQLLGPNTHLIMAKSQWFVPNVPRQWNRWRPRGSQEPHQKVPLVNQFADFSTKSISF